MTRQRTGTPPGSFTFETELARTETLVRDWRRDTDACRSEITQWDPLKPVVKDRRRAYRRANRRLRSALRTARAVTRWKFPILSSFRTQLRFRWLSLRMNSLRLQIGVIAVLIAINRVVFWALHVVIPVAAVWLIWILAQVLWDLGWHLYFSSLNL